MKIDSQLAERLIEGGERERKKKHGQSQRVFGGITQTLELSLLIYYSSTILLIIGKPGKLV